MDKNTALGIIFGMGIIIALAVGLAQFPAKSEDTIILVNKQGNDPVNSCAPGNGLILAQNLTDLCDVVIVSPSTNQILKYNGSFWVNVAQTTFNDTTTCNNIGLGNAFVCVEGTNVNLRSLLAGAGISVSNNTNTITVTNTSPDNTVCANVGSGTMIYKDGECNFKTLVGSSDISITNTTNTIIIDYNGTNNVSSVSSNDNNTIGVIPTTGNVVLYPTLKKLCEFNGVGGETSITCSFSSTAQVFSVQVHYNSTVTSTIWALRFNNDTGNNYSLRSSNNGGADSTVGSQSFLTSQTITANQMNTIFIECHDHSPTFEKLCTGDRMAKSFGGNAPSRLELYGTWNNVSNDITSINLTRTASTGTLTSSHIIVWGYN